MNNKGQALVEYVLIVAIISVITVSLVTYFGGFLKDSLTKTTCSISDEVYVEGDKPGEATCVSKEEYEQMIKDWRMMSKKGQALVEFVLLLPIIIFIILTMFDFGNIIYQKNHLENVLSNVVSLYENNYTEKEIEDKLSLQKEEISIDIENKGRKEISISLEKKVSVITPGLNYVIDNPYEISTSRSIVYES